jgi:hypothetical protein
MKGFQVTTTTTTHNNNDNGDNDNTNCNDDDDDDDDNDDDDDDDGEEGAHKERGQRCKRTRVAIACLQRAAQKGPVPAARKPAVGALLSTCRLGNIVGLHSAWEEASDGSRRM